MTAHHSARRSFLLATLAGMTALTLAGCASPAHKLTPAQIAVLKDQGFALTESGWELIVPDKVLFGFDEDMVSAEQQITLTRVARTLRSAGIDALRVDGHTDAIGTLEYNQQLSLRRAQAVARVLLACGFMPDHLDIRGFGKTRPIADNRTAAGRAENRRVAIIVTVE
ncbi:MAG: OmpA family protein [Cupriavidus sp.]|nr:OmpA family protein [Cupriavidus sp.]